MRIWIFWIWRKQYYRGVFYYIYFHAWHQEVDLLVKKLIYLHIKLMYITEELILEGTSGGHPQMWTRRGCPARFWVPPGMDTLHLWTLKCSITFTVKKYFLISGWNFVCQTSCHRAPLRRLWVCLLYTIPLYTYCEVLPKPSLA